MGYTDNKLREADLRVPRLKGYFMQAKREKYGLITSITMIIGICIGSGIFFKSDNVLAATGGSVPLGILVFAIAAISIVFGGLAVSELASRTDKPGGIIAYSEEFVSRRFACCIGWFQTLVYYPALIAVVSWVIGVYFCILFAIPASFPVQLAIGVGFYAASYLLNTFAPKAGGAMQNITTLLKLVPLIVIAVLGLAFGDPLRGISQTAPAQLQTAGWLSAIGPVAFSYDGWIVSTSISHEIRDAKRNLPKALVLAPLLVMLVYILYFTGVASLLPANEIIVLGDDHVAAIARNLLGDMGARVILIFIIISVVGTVNGLVLGFIRQPYSLALDGKLFPGSKRLARIHPKWNMPLASSLLAFSLCLFWSAAHYFTHSFDLLPNSDVSEISIALNYLLYTVLYAQVFRLYRRGLIKSRWRGIIVPLFAFLGSLIVLLGSLQNALFPLYAGFCLLVILAAFLYYQKRHRE